MVDLLWRDIDEGKARNAFRQALHRLRTALGNELIPQDREQLRLVRTDTLVIDLDGFLGAVEARRLDDALQLYGGNFLENAELGEPAFDMWAEQERTRIQGRFRQVLHDGVAAAAGAGNWIDAIARARRLLEIAPFDSAAAHVAATTLISAGRRPEAQELLRQFEARLDSELGLPLPTELQSLTSRIERQQADVPVPASSAGMGAELSLPFVGREAELSQLLTLWRTTREDAGALVLVEGDAGLGKSRLARELASHAKSLGPVTVLTGRERAAGPPVPLGLFAEALRPLVRAKGVAGASRHLLAEAARLLPELRDTFDLPPVSDVEDEASRIRFFEGVAALIDAAAFEQPILMILEDLQGISPSSLDLLSYLVVRLGASATMFTLTVRDAAAAPPVLARLRALAETHGGSAPPHGGRAQRRVLAPLTLANSFAALSQLGPPFRVSERTLARVAQRADGVPGRLLELIRRAAAGDDIATLPVSVRQLMAARLQQLPSAQRRLFVVIAMIGRPVPLNIAADAAHLPLPAVRESVDLLVRAGLVEHVGNEILASDLAADVALEAAGGASRAFLAAWIAEALERDSSVAAAELSRFYAEAGQAQPAFEAARRAAYAALAMGATTEAVQLLSSARTFASSLEQQGQIESLLAALGSGRRRLASSAEPPPPAESVEPPPAPPVLTDPLWVRLFPNWRILFGAAVATLLISAAVLSSKPGDIETAPRTAAGDTLVLADGVQGRSVRFVTGDLVSGLTMSGRADAPPSDPPWLDSLSRPWVNAIAAPGGRAVAVARVTPSGSDLYVFSADRRDTTPLVVGRGDSRPLGWSPDGRWLLASTSRTLATGGFDADLFAYRIGAPLLIRAVDTTSRRAITEAAWSPDGSRIAWVARVGEDRQQEVFMSRADGTDARNVSRHPAADSRIAWSSDGELLAFTSLRDGNAELYAMAVRENRLWRLTRDPAQDDHGVFSRSGRLIAFESTRGGTSGVYVMPSLGGDAQRLGAGLPLSVRDWRGGRSRYIDRVRVQWDSAVARGSSTGLRVSAVDQLDEPIPARDVEWIVLDSALATLSGPDSITGEQRVVGRRAGLARVVAAVGRWRSDTAFIRIGSQPVVLVDPGAESLVRQWRPLGVPAPMLDPVRGVVLNADRQWESGILSRIAVPLQPGLAFSAVVVAPLSSPIDPATAFSVALVAPEDDRAIQADAPQFLRYASLTWDADAAQMVYAVGREVFAEPIGLVDAAGPMAIRIAVEPDSTVTFAINARVRWRSALRVIDIRNEPRVQLWIGGRATGDLVRVTSVAAVLGPVQSTRQP